MMKKIASLAAAGTIFAMAVMPVMAKGHGHHHWPSGQDVNIRNNATVRNHVETEAETGEVGVMGMCVSRVGIRTGNANATSLVSNDVNTSRVSCNDCRGDVRIGNRARVSNWIETEAETGEVGVMGMGVRGVRVRTGRANAWSEVWNVVNFTKVGDGMPTLN